MNGTTLREPRWITSAVCVGPWGSTAGEMRAWLSAGGEGAREARMPPPVPGFIESPFNPLVYAVAKQCLIAGGPGRGAATAIVLGSGLGDTRTADLASQNVAKGSVHNPLLFYQSVPTSILGYVAREFGITGPLSCVSGGDELCTSMLEMADLLLEDEALQQVLVVGLELQLNPRTARVFELQGAGGSGLAADVAVGLLLRRGPGEHEGAPLVALQEAAEASVPPFPRSWRAVGGLVALCMAYERSRAGEPEAGARMA